METKMERTSSIEPGPPGAGFESGDSRWDDQAWCCCCSQALRPSKSGAVMVRMSGSVRVSESPRMMASSPAASGAS